MTMQIRALIVDDEPPARDELAYLLTSFPDVEAREAANVKQALEIIRTQCPDLVFLDIQMPGKDGFDVHREALCLPNPPLFIFVTAYDNYAVRAFEENAVDYLLKPVTVERLQISMERVRALMKQRIAAPQTGTQPAPEAQSLARLTVEYGGRIQLIPPEEVVYCERTGKQLLLHTYSESFPCHGFSTLDEFEDRVRTNQTFFRINRGMVVNLNHVREFSPWTAGKYILILDDDASTEVSLSRSRVKDFKERLGL